MLDSLVSVIIPTYNTKPEWLQQAIESALNQSYGNIEIIVVDDCSDIAFSGLDLVLKDERVLWISNEKNSGVSATRNYGAKISRGKYLAFLDSDDWWEPQKIQIQLKEIQAENLGWCYSSANLCEMGGDFQSRINAKYRGDILADLLKRQIVVGSCSSVIVKKEIFDSVCGFDVKTFLVEDWDLWIRISKNHPVTFVSEALVNLRIGNPASFSLNAGKINRVKNLQVKHWPLIVQYGLERVSQGHLECVKARILLKSGNYKSYIFHAINCIIMNKGVGYLYMKIVSFANKNNINKHGK